MKEHSNVAQNSFSGAKISESKIAPLEMKIAPKHQFSRAAVSDVSMVMRAHLPEHADLPPSL